ncbi:MAG: endo-1,4-beta-xylanase [Halanaerobiaceae bacterium]
MKSLFKSYENEFKIGAAVNQRTIKTHQDLLKDHFNSLTAENDMKFASVQPEEGRFTFRKADKIVEFARENDKAVRGHTLVWHNQTPDWVFSDQQGNQVGSEKLLARMKDHIFQVVERYKGEVYCWDVVNEAIADDKEKTLRETKWREIIGPEYIKKAFNYAHQADPEALLFYNDYNATQPQKRDKIFKLVQDLLEAGTPIHGIGIQGHWNIYSPSVDEIEAALKKYASLGLKIHITELDISVFAFDDRRKDLEQPTEEMMDLQAEKYRKVFALFREYSEVIGNVTFWGVADDQTWLDNFPVQGRKNWPLIFDTEHNPKKSFWEIIEK